MHLFCTIYRNMVIKRIRCGAPMWLYFYMYLCICAFLQVNGERRFQIGLKGKSANLDRFDGNCGKSYLPFDMTIESIESRGTKVFLNTTMRVKEDIPVEGLKLNLILSRCKSRESPDSCEIYLKHNENDVCLRASSKMWEKYYSSIHPPMTCPVKKGIYKGINCEVDLSAFLMIPSDGWFWKVQAHMNSGKLGKEIMCMVFEAQVAMTNK